MVLRFVLPWIMCECVRHMWESSRWRLTAELSWSESTRPGDGENRGIQHYHQKRLQCSLLRPHSFLQSSWWFVCLLVVSVWMVPPFESMHFSAPIICWGRRWAKEREKKGWRKRKVRTEMWGYQLFSIFLNWYIQIVYPDLYYLGFWQIHRASITVKKKKKNLTAALWLGIEASRDIFLPIIQLWRALVGTGTRNASVVRKKTYHCGEVCLILLWE